MTALPVVTSIRFVVLACCFALTLSGLLADTYSDLIRTAGADVTSGEYERAISEYQSALKLRPDSPEALNNLAVVYYQVRRYTEAYQSVAAIWKNHRELKSAALIAGLAAVQCNRPSAAIAPLNQLLETDPTNRDALLGLASAEFALQNYPKAIEVYRREIDVSSKDVVARYGLAVCLERMAEEASRTLSIMPGGSGYSKKLLGEYLQSTGDRKLAEEAFGEAHSQEADAPPSVIEQYQSARGLADQSKTAFEAFVSLAPDSWQAEVFFGDVARQHNDLVEALSHYKRAAEAKPDSPAPDLGIGTVYWEMGEFDEATKYLRETLKRNPHGMQAIFELANIAVKKHADADAIPLLTQYLESQPDALAAHADLGRAYLHLKQYKAAAPELEKAKLADEQGDIHYQLSIVLRKLGRNEEADAALAESITMRKEKLLRDQRLHEIH